MSNEVIVTTLPAGDFNPPVPVNVVQESVTANTVKINWT